MRHKNDTQSSWTFIERHGLLLVGTSPVIANLIGSALNIFYNHKQIEPLLSPVQLQRFDTCCQVFNLVVYPLAVFCWLLPLIQLRPVYGALLAGDHVATEQLARAQRLVVNLPWRILAVAGISWHVGQEAARQILAQGDGLVGTEQIITVMFVDVRNFTAHSSARSPQEVVEALNVFFYHAVDLIESHAGMVNKFLGDGFMALFGIGAENGQHALNAVKAGRAMMEHVQGAAEQLKLAGWPDFQIGIGVNSGPAVVGSVGSPKRREYTAIGDTVNVAARVEALTKTVGHDFLVTEATRQYLPEGFRIMSLPPQTVKGKGEPVTIHVVQVES